MMERVERAPCMSDGANSSGARAPQLRLTGTTIAHLHLRVKAREAGRKGYGDLCPESTLWFLYVSLRKLHGRRSCSYRELHMQGSHVAYP